MVKKRVLQILYTLGIVLAALVLVSCDSSSTSESEDGQAVTDVKAALNTDSTAVDVTWTAPSGENLWGVYVEVKNAAGDVVASGTLEEVAAAGTASIPIPAAESDGEQFTVSVSLISAADDRALLSTVVSEPVTPRTTGRTAPGAIGSVGEIDRSVPEVTETALSYPWTTWSVTLQWPAPTDPGTTAADTAATISSYDVYWAGSGKTLSAWNYDGKVSGELVEGKPTATLEPLSAAVGTYNVMIVATNSAGLTSTTMAGSLNAPTPPAAVTPRLALTPGSESSSITVTWDAPNSGTISKYAIVYVAGEIEAGSQLTQIAGMGTTYPIDGLTPGLEYEVAVYAYNEIGLRSDFTSAKITLEAANANATAPAALSAESVVYADAPTVRYKAEDKAEIVLMWNLPVDHDLGTTDGATPAELAGFVIEYNKSGDSPTRVVLSSPAEYTAPANSEVMFDMLSLSTGIAVHESSYQYTIEGLDPGLYSVSISVLNNAGKESDPLPVGMVLGESQPPIVVVLDATLPAPVTGIALEPVSPYALKVEWDVPAANTFGTYNSEGGANSENLEFSLYGIAYAAVNAGAIDLSTLGFFPVQELRPDSGTGTRTSFTLAPNPFITVNLVPNTEYVVAVRVMGKQSGNTGQEFSTVDVRIPPYTAFTEADKITMPADNSKPASFAVGDLAIADLLTVDSAQDGPAQGIQVTWPAISAGLSYDGTREDPIASAVLTITAAGSDTPAVTKDIPVPITQNYMNIPITDTGLASLLNTNVVVAVEVKTALAVATQQPGVSKTTGEVSLKAYVAPTLSVATTLSYTSIEVGLTTIRGTGILGDPLPTAGKTISWKQKDATANTGSAELTATEESHTIIDLTANTDYTIVVTYNLPTFNVIQYAYVSTLADQSAPPTITNLEILDSATSETDPALGVALVWQAAAGMQQDGTTDEIASFTINVTNAASTSFEPITVNNSGVRTGNLTMTDLDAFIGTATTFTVTVTTVGEKTASVEEMKTLSAYTAPVFTLVEPTPTDTTIPVSWTVTSPGTGILGDTLSLTDAGVEWITGTTKGGGTLATPTATSYTIEGLLAGTSYGVIVRLSNIAAIAEQQGTYTTSGTPPAQ